MALPVLPSPDNFLGVALVINRSRDGPRFVFHYPQCLLPDEGVKKTSRGGGGGGGDIDDDDDILLGRPSRDAGLETGSASALLAAELAQWNHDDHLVTESGTQIVPWEHVAGFPTKDLKNILTPARAYHKKLFQVSLDPIYCVSYPIYVPENGVWRNNKKNKDSHGKRQPQRGSGSVRKGDDGPIPTDAGGSARNGGEKGPSDTEQTEARDTLKPLTKSTDETEDKKSSMTMFNLVFFLKPKKHEVKPLVDIMFTHIIKKINKAYKYCQQRSDFVWKESKKILALKDKGREESTRPPYPVRLGHQLANWRHREEDELPVGRNIVHLVSSGIYAGYLRGCFPEPDRCPAARHRRGHGDTLGPDPRPVSCLRPAARG
jgi:hypothetical protein